MRLPLFLQRQPPKKLRKGQTAMYGCSLVDVKGRSNPALDFKVVKHPSKMNPLFRPYFLLTNEEPLTAIHSDNEVLNLNNFASPHHDFWCKVMTFLWDNKETLAWVGFRNTNAPTWIFENLIHTNFTALKVLDVVGMPLTTNHLLPLLEKHPPLLRSFYFTPPAESDSFLFDPRLAHLHFSIDSEVDAIKKRYDVRQLPHFFTEEQPRKGYEDPKIREFALACLYPTLYG